FAVGTDVALVSSAEQKLPRGKEEALAFGASVEDEKLDVHCTRAPLGIGGGKKGRATERDLSVLAIVHCTLPFCNTPELIFPNNRYDRSGPHLESYNDLAVLTAVGLPRNSPRKNHANPLGDLPFVQLHSYVIRLSCPSRRRSRATGRHRALRGHPG